MTQDKKNRILRTLFQALIGLAISIAVPAIVATTDVLSLEFKDYAWWPILSALLVALTSAVQNFVEDYKERNGNIGNDPN